MPPCLELAPARVVAEETELGFRCGALISRRSLQCRRCGAGSLTSHINREVDHEIVGCARANILTKYLRFSLDERRRLVNVIKVRALLDSPNDAARALLEELGAPPRLIRHGELVAEAAAEILAAVGRVAAAEAAVDENRVLAGAWLHDVGKSIHRSELERPGNAHESSGEQLLLARDIDPRIARMCITHAQWKTLSDDLLTIEDLLVALADSLWKGRRDEALESRVIDHLAKQSDKDRWSLFTSLDTAFEQIAEGAESRLRRSAP